MKKTTATVPPWLRSADSGAGLFSTLGATSKQVSAAVLTSTVSVRDISFPVAGELATGRLYEPAQTAGVSSPVTNLVVAVHGNGEDAAAHPGEMRMLAAEGTAAVLTLDQRGVRSAWKPGEFNVSQASQDVLAAVRWYRENRPAPTNTVLWSWSQGSLVSGLAIAQSGPATFSSWVSAMAIDDTAWFWGRLHELVPVGAELPPPLRALIAQIERDAGGTPASHPAAYQRRSLYAPTVVARLRSLPVVLLHGTQDQRVPFDRGVHLWRVLKGGHTGFYEIRSGRDAAGNVVPAGHTLNDLNPAETRLGPVWWESRSAVLRLLAGAEQTAGDPYQVIELREARGAASK